MATKKKNSSGRGGKAASGQQKLKYREKKTSKASGSGLGETNILLMPYVLLILAAILTVFLIAGSGAAGNFVSRTLRQAFGIGGYLIPVILIFNAIFYRSDARTGAYKYKWWLSLIELVLISSLWGLFFKVEGFEAGVQAEAGLSLKGGGIVGGFTVNAMRAAVGSVVTGIILILGIIVIASFIFGSSPAKLIRKYIESDNNKEKVRRKKKAIADNRAARAQAARLEREQREEQKEREAQQEQTARAERQSKAPLDLDESLEMRPESSYKTVGVIEEEKAYNVDISIDDEPDSEILEPAESYEAPSLDEIFDAPTDSEIAEKFRSRQTELTDDLQQADTAIEVERQPVEVESEPAQSKEPEEASYKLPDINLLHKPEANRVHDEKAIEALGNKLVSTLESFGVRTHILGISKGPTVTRYELSPEVGVRVRSIVNLADDIALNLASSGVRIEAPIPGKEAVGIEVPNKIVSTVYIRSLIDSDEFRNSRSRLTAALGMDVAGKPVFCDISKMPHMLIAGATGMGKSVCINSLIVSILYKATPDEVKLILIDPKKVEFSVFNGLPHLLVPVVSDPKKAAGSLCWAVTEMERRFVLIESAAVRNIDTYNEIAAKNPDMEVLPKIVIIIDELADLMMAARDDVEASICRLAQKARAAGMHLVIGTQRPSVDVITGVLKANIPSRIAFTVASQVDSRTIIDVVGAEKLVGRGDMLYAPVGSNKPRRVQGAFVDEKEIEGIVTYIKNIKSAEYSDEISDKIDKEAAHCGEKKRSSAAVEDGDGELGDIDGDDMLLPAIEVAVDNGAVSTSLLQRKLKLGYSRAARIIDTMEEMGIVGPFAGSKPREVLMSREQFLEWKMRRADQDEYLGTKQ